MELAWLIFMFITGACIGSFLNVVIYRLPRGGSIFFPSRSYCPKCGHPIKGYDNIPLVSWLALKGRCRSCKAPISPRYIIIEAITALLVCGLFAWYFIGHWASHTFFGGHGLVSKPLLWPADWPMFLSHAALVCGLLVCAVVDIETWTVPLEVCWFVSIVGIAVAGAAPAGWLGAASASDPLGDPMIGMAVSPACGAAAIGAAIGLVMAIILTKYGFIQQSFLDADESAPAQGGAAGKGPDGKSSQKAMDRKPGDKSSKKKGQAKKASARREDVKERIQAVAITSRPGLSVRTEILREVIFLAPPVIMAFAAYMLVTRVAPLHAAWYDLHGHSATANAWISGHIAQHIVAGESALFGYMIGGLLVWGTRILGTLAFGKEAMGLGDVHIMAAVGACAGWLTPTLAFFIAPIFGLAWAVYLWLARGQRELPYGPWLAAASLAVMLFHDKIMAFVRVYFMMQ